MEVIIVPIKEYNDSPVLKDRDFVNYIHADQSLRDAARDIDNIHGFLHGKAVVVKYQTIHEQMNELHAKDMLDSARHTPFVYNKIKSLDMGNDPIHEATLHFGTKLRESHEEAIKELLRHAGIDPDTINQDNFDDAKKEMYRKGYRIEQYSEANTSGFNLYSGYKFIIGMKLTQEFEYKNEKATMKIKREFTKSP